MKIKNKFDNFNLLIFSTFSWNNQGVARIFFEKSMLKSVLKIIKKNRKLVESQIVKIVSDFLTMPDIFLRVNLSNHLEEIPENLLYELSFLLIENYKNLLIFTKNNNKDILVITLLKNTSSANNAEWIAKEDRQTLLAKKISKQYYLNLIVFQEPVNTQPIDENPIKLLGRVKLFLQSHLAERWTYLNDLEMIFSDLKNEKIFPIFSFNVSSNFSQLNKNALVNMAKLIYHNLTVIKQHFSKFACDLILEFAFDEYDQFEFTKVSCWAK